jgi:hypothetical protein
MEWSISTGGDHLNVGLFDAQNICPVCILTEGCY